MPSGGLTLPGDVDLSPWEGQYSPATLAAVKAILAAKPEQVAQNTGESGFDLDGFINSTVGWWSDNGSQVADKLNQFGPEVALLDSLGYKINPAAVPAGTALPDGSQGTGTGLGTLSTTGGTPLEQQLFGTILNDYINPDLAGDAQRRTDTQGIVDSTNRSLDTAINVNNEVLDGTQLARLNANADTTAAGLAASAAQAAQTKLAALDQRKTEMTAALDRMSSDRSGALDAQTAQLRTGLAQLETERQAALQQLNTARIAAAEGQVTGINQGLQSARDDITAADATQGFVGGSTMQDAALARATIGARQNAAEAMGTAKVANATDSRSLGDEMANGRFQITSGDANARRDIADQTATGRFNLADTTSGARVDVNNNLADQTQNATNTGVQMRSGYAENDFANRLQAALLPASLNAQRLNLLTAADNAGHAGLDRSLNYLNWFANGSNPPATSGYTVQPSTVGNDIASLGAGITKGAFNMGSAIDWSQVFNPRAGVGAATNYADFLRRNPGSSAATTTGTQG